jgi:hypothetical protein
MLLGQLEYSLISNKCLIITDLEYNESKSNETILTINIENGEKYIDRFSTLNTSKNTINWTKNINAKEVIIIWADKLGSSTHRPKTGILTIPLKYEKTNSLREEERIIVDSLINIYGESKSYELLINASIELENERTIYPILDWKEVTFERNRYLPIDYDILSLGERKYLIFIKNSKELTIWKYYYPEVGTPKVHREGRNDWTEEVTYSKDTLVFFSSQMMNRCLPSGNKHIYESIKDSSFFQGHFKVVQQGSETFCINTNTGFIYHIGDEDIARVGEIELKNYPRWLLGKPLFIEDRAAGQLVFLSDVQRTNETRPFPEVVVLKSRAAVNVRYPGLRGK